MRTSSELILILWYLFHEVIVYYLISVKFDVNVVTESSSFDLLSWGQFGNNQNNSMTQMV